MCAGSTWSSCAPWTSAAALVSGLGHLQGRQLIPTGWCCLFHNMEQFHEYWWNSSASKLQTMLALWIFCNASQISGEERQRDGGEKALCREARPTLRWRNWRISRWSSSLLWQQTWWRRPSRRNQTASQQCSWSESPECTVYHKPGEWKFEANQPAQDPGTCWKDRRKRWFQKEAADVRLRPCLDCAEGQLKVEAWTQSCGGEGETSLWVIGPALRLRCPSDCSVAVAVGAWPVSLESRMKNPFNLQLPVD